MSNKGDDHERDGVCVKVPPAGIHENVEKVRLQDGTTETLRWVDKTKDPTKASRKTEAGSYRMDAIRTSYIEFHVEEPHGASVKCTCNECWLTYWIPPLREPVECPRCHAAKFNQHTEQVLSEAKTGAIDE